MKTKTPFQIQKFIPANENDFAYAGQISDHPDFAARVGRILVIEKYFIDHTNKRIQIYGCLIHVNLTTMKKMVGFVDQLEDWVISNGYKVAERDSNGFAIENPDFINEDDKEDGVGYSDSQMTPFKVDFAFNRFSKMLKDYQISTTLFFQKYVDAEDLLNDTFDHYGNIQQYLLEKPISFKNPD